MTSKYLNLEAFRATREAVDSVQLALGFDDFRGDVPGYVYEGVCYIEKQEDGKFYLLIDRSDSIDADLAKLERMLWANWYLHQFEDAAVSKNNGTLDDFICGYMDAFEAEIDGDTFGQLFSGKDVWTLDEAIENCNTVRAFMEA